MTVLSLSSSRSVDISLKEYFKSRDIRVTRSTRFDRSTGRMIFSTIKQIAFSLFFLSMYIPTPNSFEGIETAITREEEFSRETHFSLQLFSLLPDNRNDPKSLRNEWEKSRGRPIREGLKLGTKSIPGDGEDVAEEGTRPIACIDQRYTGHRSNPSQHDPRLSRSSQWKPQLTNGRTPTYAGFRTSLQTHRPTTSCQIEPVS